MFAIPPLLAEMAPGILGILLAAGGWFAMKRTHDRSQKHRN